MVLNIITLTLSLIVVGWFTCKYDGWTLHGGICYKPLFNHTFGTYFKKGVSTCATQAPTASLVMPMTDQQYQFVINSYQ